MKFIQEKLKYKLSGCKSEEAREREERRSERINRAPYRNASSRNYFTQSSEQNESSLD